MTSKTRNHTCLNLEFDRKKNRIISTFLPEKIKT